MRFADDVGTEKFIAQAIEDAKKMQEDFDWEAWLEENAGKSGRIF